MRVKSWYVAVISRLEAVSKAAPWKSLALGVLILPLIIHAYREVTRNVLIIDPFTVPKIFADAGLTPEVLANGIGDALRQIEESTRTRMQKDSLAIGPDTSPTPDIEIPGTKLGLRTVIEELRSTFGIYTKHISGDVFVPVGAVSEVPSSSINIQATIALYASLARDQRSSTSVQTDVSNVDLLIHGAADAALRLVNPYL